MISKTLEEKQEMEHILSCGVVKYGLEKELQEYSPIISNKKETVSLQFPKGTRYAYLFVGKKDAAVAYFNHKYVNIGIDDDFPQEEFYNAHKILKAYFKVI